MLPPARLSSTWRVLLRGGEDAVADLEKLEGQREKKKKAAKGTEVWSWRQVGWRFSCKGGKAARTAFDAFTEESMAAATPGCDPGDVYEALRRGADQQEVGVGDAAQWRRLADDAFPALRKYDSAPALLAKEWRPSVVDSDLGGKETEKKEATVEWFVARIDALPQKALSTLDVALATAAAARRQAGVDFETELLEVLGFTDEALAVIAEVVEKKAAIAALDPREIRAAAGGSTKTDPQQFFAADFADFHDDAATGKQSRKKRWKQEQALARQQKTQQQQQPGADVLAALGLAEAPQERVEKPTHAEALLTDTAREYHAARTGLPADAERKFGDGYEEVVLPPPPRLPEAGPSELVTMDRFPEWARQCFPTSTKSLNRIQSAVYPCCFGSQRNTLVCAPTGAGKTFVALLCVLELVKRTREIFEFQDVALELAAHHKVVYIAPLKALAQEVVQKFGERLKPLGLNVKELTGDVQLSKRDADAAHVLVATPEKWDVVTRKQGTEGSLAARCSLLIVDEIHLLAEERGAVLECIVARTRRLVESSQSHIRLVGLSATLPNYLDVAEFLACPKDGVFFFGPEFRPVPLRQTFVGVGDNNSSDKTTNGGGGPLSRMKRLAKLDDLAYEKTLDAVDRGHQVMIFVHSRKETASTAKYLKDRARREGRGDAFAGSAAKLSSKFSQALEKTRHKELKDLAPFGLTVHHAGMSRGDRGLAEDMFARGAARVLCCTATLAWGVNLPAHAVICKGTEVYDPQRGGHVDLSVLDVLQIFGRAGRPQFDDFGEATLLTSASSLPDYLRKLARASPIESCLVPRLADAVNAEVAAGTVSSVSDASKWLDHTFLAVRLRKNPQAYGGGGGGSSSSHNFQERKLELVRSAAARLDDARMVRYSKKTGALGGTDVGRVGSHYYLRHESVREFGTALSDTDGDPTILAAVCSAREFDQLKPRTEEIPELDRLRLDPRSCPLHRVGGGYGGGGKKQRRRRRGDAAGSAGEDRRRARGQGGLPLPGPRLPGAPHELHLGVGRRLRREERVPRLPRPLRTGRPSKVPRPRRAPPPVRHRRGATALVVPDAHPPGRRLRADAQREAPQLPGGRPP
mmetsp:Transcript_13025/g.42445  ORF Transcript_13025/g.42445 Transcript_13025/m.42445 type:complete len:1094 (+) Transcript_13025:42-3323(+)